MAAKIKKGDRVVVLTGKDKGKTGSVLKVFPKEQRVLVELCRPILHALYLKQWGQVVVCDDGFDSLFDLWRSVCDQRRAKSGKDRVVDVPRRAT